MMTKAKPAAAQKPHWLFQWLMVFYLVSLLVGNNVYLTPIFSKPVLAAVLCIYICTIIWTRSTALPEAMGVLVRPYSMPALWTLFMCSYFWSKVPMASLNNILTLTAFLILAIFISIYHKTDGFSKQLRTSAIIIMACVVLYTLMAPGSLATSAGATSFYSQKNNFGMMMGLCTLILLNVPGRNRWHVCIALLAIMLLVLSQSKTSMLVLLAVSGLLWLINRRAEQQRGTFEPFQKKLRFLPKPYTLALLSLVLLVLFRDSLLDLLWDNLSKTFLTGRGTLWLTVIQQVRGNSLLGIGPSVFWDADRASEVAHTSLASDDPLWIQKLGGADGGYIDLIASVGVLGLALFLYTAADLYRGLSRNWERPDSRLMFVLSTFVLLHAIAETTLLTTCNVLWLVYLLCYFRVAGYERERIAAKV